MEQRLSDKLWELCMGLTVENFKWFLDMVVFSESTGDFLLPEQRITEMRQVVGGLSWSDEYLNRFTDNFEKIFGGEFKNDLNSLQDLREEMEWLKENCASQSATVQRLNLELTQKYEEVSRLKHEQGVLIAQFKGRINDLQVANKRLYERIHSEKSDGYVAKIQQHIDHIGKNVWFIYEDRIVKTKMVKIQLAISEEKMAVVPIVNCKFNDSNGHTCEMKSLAGLQYFFSEEDARNATDIIEC